MTAGRMMKAGRRTFVVLAAVSVAGLVLFGLAAHLFWWSATPDFEDTRAVKLPPGSSVEVVADSLVSAGILAKRTGFVWLAGLTGWGSQIKAGHYRFASGASNMDLLLTLRQGLQSPIRIRVPGGTRRERLIRGMARDMAFTEAALDSVLSDPAFASELGTDTTHLWAWMVPDSYDFYWLTDPKDVVRRIKAHADRSVSAALDTLGTLPRGYTRDEIIRLAGIIEWETNHVAEKRTISGVYHNRLRDRWRLDADPTVQYAVMLLEGDKRRLFFRDYRIDHPYNTYRRGGLPPGPITNPSLTSIEAAMTPESHGYYFFVARGDGTHIFSRTLAEHRRRANEYYRIMRERRAEQARQSADSAAAE
jgi:UPF0755 protein